MTNEIKVLIYDAGRKFLYMYYDDPISGRRETKSTKQANKKEAGKVAGKWEAELNAGTYSRPLKMTWEDFTSAYEREVFPKLAAGTRSIRATIFNLLTAAFQPLSAAHIATTRTMAEFQQILRTQGKQPRQRDNGSAKPKSKGKRKEKQFQAYSESGILAYLQHLKSIWNWAAQQGFIKQAPAFVLPKIASDELMRGRAITAEEFDRMIAAVPLVRKIDAEQYERFLRGLWLSGLRLSEALRLSWDETEPFCVWTSGRFPQFRIYAEAQKRRKSQFVPMAPDFWEFVSSIPEEQRRGPVLFLDNKAGSQSDSATVCRAISSIGQKAGIVTNRDRGEFASAHDLRRSFGSRWARKVKPITLQRLMRHTKIETTLKYYADTEGDWTSEEIWGTVAVS